MCVVAQEDLATGVRKDEVAEVQVEQAEREVGAAAEQGRSWGPSCALLLAAMRSLRALVCRQVLTDLSQRTRRIKFLMSWKSRCDFGGLGVRVSLSQESEEGSLQSTQGA